MEKKKEDRKLNQKNFRCTQFEYSSSESDSEEESSNKSHIKNLSKKKFESSKYLDKCENKSSMKKKKEKPKIYLSRYIRMILFFLLLFFSVVIDLDAGIIVSCYKSFINDLNMSDLQYGSLNSITTIGKIISLLFYMIIINKNHRKFIIVFTSFLHGLSFYGYFINDNYYYIAILNFFISFCKAFVLIYIPVWIEQFGIKKYKTLLLTIVYMVTSYGRIVGAWIGTVIFNNEWKKAFFCSGIIFLTLSFGLFIIPQKYYSTKYMFVEHQKKYTGNIIEKLVPTKNTEIEMKKEIENINDIEYIDDDNNNKLTKSKKNNQEFEINENIEEINDDKNTKLIYDYDRNERNMKKLSIINKLKIILLNRCFFFSSISRACLFFIFRIIHVYLKQYTFEVLNYNDEITFFYYYSLTTILAPSLGSLIGGVICNKYLGGYESKKSIWLVLFFGTIAGIFISLVRIAGNFKYLIFNIFGYFFSVSTFLPTISGYIINSLNKELKGFGSSFDNLINNILGKLPSPIIYGMMNDRFKDKDPKYAWDKSLMIYYIGIIFIYLACLFKWKLNNIKNKNIKKNDIVEQTLKDYNLNQNNFIKPEKPIPKYNKTIKPVELENIDTNISYSINEMGNGNNKNEFLNISQKQE